MIGNRTRSVRRQTDCKIESQSFGIENQIVIAAVVDVARKVMFLIALTGLIGPADASLRFGAVDVQASRQLVDAPLRAGLQQDGQDPDAGRTPADQTHTAVTDDDDVTVFGGIEDQIAYPIDKRIVRHAPLGVERQHRRCTGEIAHQALAEGRRPFDRACNVVGRNAVPLGNLADYGALVEQRCAEFACQRFADRASARTEFSRDHDDHVHLINDATCGAQGGCKISTRFNCVVRRTLALRGRSADDARKRPADIPRRDEHAVSAPRQGRQDPRSMFVAIGWAIVVGAVIGSYILSGGHVAALLQPFELMCILGASIGAFVVSNPVKILKAVIGVIPKCFAGPAYTKKKYIEIIGLLFELLQKIRTQGMLAMEPDVSDPKTSAIFSKYPAVLKDHHLLDFIVDYFRMMLEGNADKSAIEDLMNAELETHHAEAHAPAAAVQGMADGLPAFGIVSAVMGVVHTMGSVGAPPAVLGEMIAAALVGTFLGILMGYGFVGPLASVIAARAADEAVPYECVKSIILAYLGGSAPGVAVEYGRKVLFAGDRPSFNELDEAMKATKESAPPAAAAAAAAA